MRPLFIVSIAVLVALAVATPASATGAVAQTDVECEYPLELTDASGETVSLEEPPERVVTVLPSDAQTAYEIGAEDVIVGMPVVPATEDLEVGDRTDVTEEDGFTVDVEAVVALDPDVVLVANAADPTVVEQLRDLGIEVYQFEQASSVDDVRGNVAVTGALTGECDGAAATIEWMDERLDLIESAADDADRQLVYYEMGEGYTAGPGTFQHELLGVAGLENVADAAGVEGWGTVSEEDVLEQDPDWLLYGDDWPEEPFAESVQGTTAYEEGNVVVVDSNDFSQPGPNVVFAAEELLEAVHPDAHAEIADDLEELDAAYEAGEDLDDEGAADDADDGTDEESTDGDASDEESIDGDASDEESTDGDASDEADDSTEEEDDSTPGFGVALALASLLAVVGGTVRRR